MPSPPAAAALSVDLQGGWSCAFHFRQTASGDYAGVAEILHRGGRQGVLVIMQQPSLDAAVARTRLRARQFVGMRSPVDSQAP
ncbi:hypothetical protein CLU95_5445 [Variovorax sp. 54]|uniref:hypothetical protein n=1 Tax=Variovorax sp. 54 TaxID=2035212 RepID=UPI000C1800CB|nr:hypothetical protein [Variovorax sp. 54]PIF78261.1 hypothetical protein CLU95_5445 [Variovorax sp. 54]